MVHISNLTVNDVVNEALYNTCNQQISKHLHMRDTEDCRRKIGGELKNSVTKFEKISV